MSETNRILDLDSEEVVVVKLAGREFTLNQQRRAVLERVLRVTQNDVTNEEDTNEDKPLADTLFENWDKAMPAFALMFGYEDTTTKEYKETIDFLQENLKVKQAIQIFETWWEMNGVQDFFDRGGRLTIPPMIVEAIRKDRDNFLTQALQTPNS